MLLTGFAGFALGRFSGGGRLQPPAESDLGMAYHEWSKPGTPSIVGVIKDWGGQPPLYKTYPQAQRILLPKPESIQGLSTEETIQRRRSVRDYSGQPMSLEELGRLLYYCDGENAESWGHRLRAAPSAGALYPIEVYVVANRVNDLQPGLYHYMVQNHALELLQEGNLQGTITRCGLSQEFLGQANVVLVFTAIFQRLRWRYQQRAYRYALLEAGHLGENVYLAATSMGCGACAVGAFLDNDLNELLSVDGRDEAALYMLAVGKV